MKSEVETRAKLAELESDERYQAGLKTPATIDINAPLALIQLEFESRITALKWVLK